MFVERRVGGTLITLYNLIPQLNAILVLKFEQVYFDQNKIMISQGPVQFLQYATK